MVFILVNWWHVCKFPNMCDNVQMCGLHDYTEAQLQMLYFA